VIREVDYPKHYAGSQGSIWFILTPLKVTRSSIVVVIGNYGTFLPSMLQHCLQHVNYLDTTCELTKTLDFKLPIINVSGQRYRGVCQEIHLKRKL